MAGVMTPDTVFSDRGGYQIPGCTGAKCYRINAGGAAYGQRRRSSRAITVSSDAYFYNVGAQFWLQRDRFGGDDGMQNLLHAVRDRRPHRRGPHRRDSRAACRPRRGSTTSATAVDCDDPDWRTGDNVNMAIGQGDVLVTPLQLANGYATFANGGTRYVPQIALRAQALPDRSRSPTSSPPRSPPQVALPPEVREPLLDGLVGVPRSGTATRAFAGFPLDHFPVAAKTGTAQVDNKADTAVFAAFGPAPAPRYAISVFLEESGFGGTAAAPGGPGPVRGLSGVRAAAARGARRPAGRARPTA